MKALNARITDVTPIGLDADEILCSNITFHTQLRDLVWRCIFTAPGDSWRYGKLLNFTASKISDDLNSKIVRVIVDDNDKIKCFGDPIDDKFVQLFTDECKEITEMRFYEIQNCSKLKIAVN